MKRMDIESNTPSRISYSFEGKDSVVRTTDYGVDSARVSVLNTSSHGDPRLAFLYSYLGAAEPEYLAPSKDRFTYIDLFCGGGGLSLGVEAALKSLGCRPKQLVAVDFDPNALALVKNHFSPIVGRVARAEELVSYSVDHSQTLSDFITQPRILDPRIAQFKGKVDLLVGGPPCQGHSNLNNRTRRFDPRNLLYYVMPAFAVALSVPIVVIENVKSIANAAEKVVEVTKSLLRTHGYDVQEVVLNAADFGVAQYRERHFLIAQKIGRVDVGSEIKGLQGSSVTFDQMVGSLDALPFDVGLLEAPGRMSKENQSRINYLHDEDLYDLPNAERPNCHKDGHSYPSVYGRIRADQPVGTITTGFASPGRGRYIHPTERRVISIREAARLQSFPDRYWNSAGHVGLAKAHLQKVVGDAVPPLLAEAIVLSLRSTIHLVLKAKKLA